MIIIVYCLICNLLLFFKLHQAVASSPIKTYECVHLKSQPVTELETSSSEIRIESEDDTDQQEKDSLISTKSYVHRERVESSDLGEDAGLPI